MFFESGYLILGMYHSYNIHRGALRHTKNTEVSGDKFGDSMITIINAFPPNQSILKLHKNGVLFSEMQKNMSNDNFSTYYYTKEGINFSKEEMINYFHAYQRKK